MWIGQNVVESPYEEIGQVATVIYFLYFAAVIPFFGKFEDYLLRFNLKNSLFGGGKLVSVVGVIVRRSFSTDPR